MNKKNNVFYITYHKIETNCMYHYKKYADHCFLQYDTSSQVVLIFALYIHLKMKLEMHNWRVKFD